MTKVISEKMVHDIRCGIQFLYPCIAYTEKGNSHDELYVIAETSLKTIYPPIMNVKGMKFLGDDYWGRPTFKDEKEQYYCELDGLVYFKGYDFDGEPHYPTNHVLEVEYPEIDPNYKEMDQYIEKVKEFSSKLPNVQLINYEIDLSNTATEKAKIVCKYHFKIEETN